MYFDLKLHLKHLIRFYEEVEHEYRQRRIFYLELINIAKQDHNHELLMESRILLGEIDYLYHSIKVDKQDALKQIQLLID